MEQTGFTEDWNAIIAALPGAHILQTREWAQIKETYGWQTVPIVWKDERGKIEGAASVLERTIRVRGINTGLRVLYVPRGPLIDWKNGDLRRQVIRDLIDLAKKRNAIFIKIDPEVVTGQGIPGSENDQQEAAGLLVVEELHASGWRFSKEQIQFRNTAWLDLEGSEDDWLARMKQKTRYNLRLAGRKGVSVRSANLIELDQLYKMYTETAIRDGFIIRPEHYYQKVWSQFIQAGMAEALIAEVEGEMVAGLILFTFAGRAWYLYGMSREIHRDKMPNYLLQWEAMRRAKQRGCRLYDLWGAPDDFDERDSMWGVFRFKEGLGAKVIRTIGAWDYAARPVLYPLYTRVLPEVLDWMRRRGRQRMQREVSL